MKKDYKKLYEETKKLYDGTLEKAKELNDRYKDSILGKTIEYLFPQLKESEDEKMRKWLIGYFEQYKIDGMGDFANGYKVDDIVAWLEKHGEKKSDKFFKHMFDGCLYSPNEKQCTTPLKFRIGDKVHCGDITQPITIIDLRDDAYLTDSAYGVIPFSEQDEWELVSEDDERIRKRLVDIVKGALGVAPIESEQKDLLAWIEKFGEHKEATCVAEIIDRLSEKEQDILFKELELQKEQKPVKWTEEDEKIRKGLIKYLQKNHYSLQDDIAKGIEVKDAIAWLEKQGEEFSDLPKWRYKKDSSPLLRDSLILNKYGCVAKSLSGALVSDVWVLDYDELAKLPKEESEKQGEQKPDNKIEPKFREGEWIISNNKKSTYQVIEVKRGIYVIRDNADNHEYHIGIEECEKSGRLWNISDAKDGDVLVDEDNNIGILQECDCVWWNSYIYLGCDGKLRGYSIGGRHKQTDTHPATKEQRNLLFQKIHEAGYEWDAEKKELKITDWSKHIKYDPNSPSIIKEKPAEWSLTDEAFFEEIDETLYMAEKGRNDVVKCQIEKERAWFKSLKDRVQLQNHWKPSAEQKPAEWTEEDESKLREIRYALYDCYTEGNAEELMDWIKTLLKGKSRFEEGYKVGASAAKYNQWKPSEEQMECLKPFRNEKMYPILSSLYNDLKKL